MRMNTDRAWLLEKEKLTKLTLRIHIDGFWITDGTMPVYTCGIVAKTTPWEAWCNYLRQAAGLK